MGGMRNAYKTLIGKPERKRPFARPMRRWDDDDDDNNRVVLREMVWEAVGWIHLAHYRGQWRVLVNAEMNLRVP
jgi:hypothetical protein